MAVSYCKTETMEHGIWAPTMFMIHSLYNAGVTSVLSGWMSIIRISYGILNCGNIKERK